MKKTVNFCNFCGKYVADEKDGRIMYTDGDGMINQRIFDKATHQDVCVCNNCCTQLGLLLL